jgi:hypothetical protein
MEISIKQQQENLLEKLKEYSNSESSHQHSVWYWPEGGKFLHNDYSIKYEVVQPLIQEKKLVFKQIESHQGMLMPRYILVE